jgi:hypothetical protein
MYKPREYCLPQSQKFRAPWANLRNQEDRPSHQSSKWLGLIFFCLQIRSRVLKKSHQKIKKLPKEKPKKKDLCIFYNNSGNFANY